MADLSGVLRKTIDGLPRATPQMRAKVYEKARAAIQRQVNAANPPLAEEVVAARLAAIEDAIERTERHYQAADAGSQADAGQAAAPPVERTEPPVAPSPPPSSFSSPAPQRPSDRPAEQRRDPPMQAPTRPLPASPQSSPPSAARSSSSPAGPAARAPQPDLRSPVAPPVASPRADETRREPGAMPEHEVFPGFKPVEETRGRQAPSIDRDARDPDEQPFYPLADEDSDHDGAPASVGAPFVVPAKDRAGKREEREERGEERRQERRRSTGEDWDGEPLPAGVRSDDDFIPQADVSAPRYVKPRRRKTDSRGGAGKAVAACVVILLLGGLGTAGWLYRDDIEALLVEPQGIETIAGNANADLDGETDQSSGGENAAANTDGQPGDASTDGGTAPVDVASNEPASDSTRAFTQRLMPDGSEVDDGPATPQPNAFDEGTNIAAASPVDNAGSGDDTPTVSSEIGSDPQTVGGETDTAASDEPAAGEAADTNAEVAAIAPNDDAAAPAVAQKAVFYQERTETAPGTQETGNVVWSVVNEPPIDGQPAEPAVRAVVEIPDEGLTMTMTIRRNADPTLPASHVIEILFNTSDAFKGGGIANVQRLALKATEQARGEPLIGVAGKISDGFFIVALNNLDEATKNNLTLLRNQQWIDIPIGYATGRRALISIEKGIPGEQAFNEAIDAWNAKT